MRKLCKNCAHFEKCNVDGKSRTEDDTQPSEVRCWVRKPKPTHAEISAMRSEFGKRGGRPKGSGKGQKPVKCASLDVCDHDVLLAYAALKGMTLRKAVHKVCGLIVRQYPDLAPDGWDAD